MTKARDIADGQSVDTTAFLTSESTLNPAKLDNTGTIPSELLDDIQGVPSGQYTLVDVADYHETVLYQATASTNMFQCTNNSLTFTTTDQTNGDDVILIHGSLSALSDVDDNGFGIFMVHSTDPTFATYSTTLQTGRYGEALMAGEYTNTTGFAKLTGLSASTQYYVRMYAMIQRPTSGTVNINQDGYATSGSVRHGVVAQQFMKNPT